MHSSNTVFNLITDINQTALIGHAERIVRSKYMYSVFEIDDMWIASYGDLSFDSIKFPDPKAMIKRLHDLNFKVTLWVTPFCDYSSEVYVEGMVKRYWVMKKVRNEVEVVTELIPATVLWWNNQRNGSAVLDVTNPEAIKWFVDRLNRLKSDYGIDGFKMDAGETVYIPSLIDPDVLYHNVSLLGNGSRPLMYTFLYGSIASVLGDFTEVRAAYKQNKSLAHILSV